MEPVEARRPKIIGALWWGFNAPGCFVWARIEPNGRLYVMADLKFQQKGEDAIAFAVAQKSDALDVRLSAAYADESLFDLTNPDERQTIHVETPADVLRRYGLSLVPVSASQYGWQRLHDYLRDAPDGSPWLVVSPDCTAITRTLPTLIQKPTDVEEVGDGPSYAAQALRILVSARPSPSALQKRRPVYPWGTLGWLKQQDEKVKERARAPLRRR